MTIRRKLQALVRVITDEAARNPEFNQKLCEAIGFESQRRDEDRAKDSRPRRRRAPAAFDPVAMLREHNVQQLRSQLSKLDLEQLKDIVAQYGMDTEKLVMKWRTPKRIVDRIVDISTKRVQKGDAFRDGTRTALESDQSTPRQVEAQKTGPTDSGYVQHQNVGEGELPIGIEDEVAEDSQRK